MRANTLIGGPATMSLALACAVMARPVPAGAQEEPTYARDVAPILQAKCQVCHQPGSIAPMSLMTFEAVKRYAPRIREKVSQRIMPPWHIDRSVGIQEFKNDRGLTDEELETLVAWLDGDMPFGDEADLPPPPSSRTAANGSSRRPSAESRTLSCGPTPTRWPPRPRTSGSVP